MMENPLAIFLISKEFAYIAANGIEKKSNKGKIFDFLFIWVFHWSEFFYVSIFDDNAVIKWQAVGNILMQTLVMGSVREEGCGVLTRCCESYSVGVMCNFALLPGHAFLTEVVPLTWAQSSPICLVYLISLFLDSTVSKSWNYSFAGAFCQIRHFHLFSFVKW